MPLFCKSGFGRSVKTSSVPTRKQSLVPDDFLTWGHQKLVGVGVQRVDHRIPFQCGNHGRDDQHRAARFLQPLVPKTLGNRVVVAAPASGEGVGSVAQASLSLPAC